MFQFAIFLEERLQTWQLNYLPCALYAIDLIRKGNLLCTGRRESVVPESSRSSHLFAIAMN